MIYATLGQLRSRLQADAALAAYVEQHYPGATLRHFIGSRMRLDGEGRWYIASDDYPYIALAPLQEAKPPRPERTRGQRLSIMWGFNEPTIEDGICLGLRRCAEFGELILAALDKQPIGQGPALVWDGAAESRSDAGTQHPYYEGESIIELKVHL